MRHRISDAGAPMLSHVEIADLLVKATSTNALFPARYAALLGVLAQVKVATTVGINETLGIHPEQSRRDLSEMKELGWVSCEEMPWPGHRNTRKVWRLAVPFAQLLRLITEDSARREEVARTARERLMALADELTVKQFTVPDLPPET
jgi:predicted transcriptional regulator